MEGIRTTTQHGRHTCSSCLVSFSFLFRSPFFSLSLSACLLLLLYVVYIYTFCIDARSLPAAESSGTRHTLELTTTTTTGVVVPFFFVYGFLSDWFLFQVIRHRKWAGRDTMRKRKRSQKKSKISSREFFVSFLEHGSTRSSPKNVLYNSAHKGSSSDI